MISQHDVLVAALGLIASVLGGAILAMLRKVLHAQRDTTAKVVANTDAKAASVLDVASLQSWARGVDVQLAGLQDQSPQLAQRLDTSRRLRDAEAALRELGFELEGEIRDREGAAGL